MGSSYVLQLLWGPTLVHTSKKVFSAQPDEDDIGLKSKTSTNHYLITNRGHVNALVVCLHSRKTLDVYYSWLYIRSYSDV